MLSFDTPESPAGLFVSMSNFQGFGADFVGLNSERTGAKLYLNIKWTKIPKPTPPPEEAAAPTKLAIGVEGGFQVDDEQYDYEKVRTAQLFAEHKKDSAVTIVLTTHASLCRHTSSPSTRRRFLSRCRTRTYLT